MPQPTNLPTLADFLEDTGPAGVFRLVEPFAVQVIGAPWPGKGGVVCLVAYVNEAPDGALYAFVEPSDPDAEEWYLATLALGWNKSTSTIWTFVPPHPLDWPYQWLASNVKLAIAAGRQIARFRRERMQRVTSLAMGALL